MSKSLTILNNSDFVGDAIKNGIHKIAREQIAQDEKKVYLTHPHKRELTIVGVTVTEVFPKDADNPYPVMLGKTDDGKYWGFWL